MGLTHTTRSDIVIDTSDAPWMKIARAELGKSVKEVQRYESFKVPLLRSLTQNSPRGPTLLDWTKVNRDLVKSFSRAVSQTMEKATVRDNPDIANYLRSVKTDPLLDKTGRGRSYALPVATETPEGWKVAAWCAAFVNWCLAQCDAPRLGYATASAWLRFGTPIAAPVPGCITITKPSSATGSTTGHVAFFVERLGSRVVLLGGNQVNGSRISETSYPEAWVLGYRWPTRVNATETDVVIA